MSIPVVMVHGGKSRPGQVEDFLVTTLKQASQWNDQVILLGGPRVKGYASQAQVKYYDYFKNYYAGARDFIGEHYVQLSGYPRPYDIAVMERYFVLRDFMIKHNVDVLCNLDSDVMVYCDLSKEASKFPVDMFGAYCIPLVQFKYRLSASAHTSFFTRTGIVKFCEFMIASYTESKRFAVIKEKWDWHVREDKPGGVCDMTHLYLFAQEFPSKVYNLTGEVLDDGVFEHNINVSENGLPEAFRMSGKKKELVWKDGCPYGFSTALDKLVRFNTLHLQGNSRKQQIGEYFREN